MELRLYDVTMASGNPSSLLGTLSAVPPTGGGAVTVGSATTPFLAGPVIEPIYRVVSDIGNGASPSLPCPAGYLSQQQFIATNTGGAQFKVNTTTGAQLPRFSYGIVVSPPTLIGGPNGTFVQNVPGGQSLICVEGMAVAVAGTTTAAGALLGSYGATTPGTLTTNAGTSPGQVLAIGMAAITGGAAGIVKVGGF